jgi:hypothetical protein
MAMLKDMIVGPKKPKEPEQPVIKKPEEERVNPAAMLGLTTNAGGAAGLMTPAPTGRKKNLGRE